MYSRVHISLSFSQSFAGFVVKDCSIICVQLGHLKASMPLSTEPAGVHGVLTRHLARPNSMQVHSLSRTNYREFVQLRRSVTRDTGYSDAQDRPHQESVLSFPPLDCKVSRSEDVNRFVLPCPISMSIVDDFCDSLIDFYVLASSLIWTFQTRAGEPSQIPQSHDLESHDLEFRLQYFPVSKHTANMPCPSRNAKTQNNWQYPLKLESWSISAGTGRLISP